MKTANLFSADSFFQAVIDSVQFGVLVADREGYLIYINNLARSLLDFKNDINARKVYCGEIDCSTSLNFLKVIHSGEPRIRIPVISFSRPLSADLFPIVLNGEIAGVISVFRELECNEYITEYLQKCKLLTGQMEALIESSYDGIFVTNSKGVVIRSNAAYDRISGVSFSEFIGKNLLELEKEGQISESVTLKVLKSRKTETITQRIRDGKEVLATGNPIFNYKGEVIMVLTNIRDMTDLNKMSHELNQSKEIISEYKKRLQERQRASRPDNMVIFSSAMKDVYQTVMRVSGTNATVFLHGETGVGKEIIAEEIHQLSERSKTGIMVKINCGAIPETLIESELFGYAQGAYTGANKEGKLGLFEIADGGTLFLDEIDSMPVALQSKLLTVLQNFEIRRLGSTTSKKVNVRLICASNQDMNELLQKKLFRSDLYYRLNVIPIHIPPLRERSDAIPYIIQTLMKRFNQKHAMKKTMSEECCEMLTRSPWPGNIRELANVIEGLIILSPGDCIMAGQLPKELLTKQVGGKADGLSVSLKEQLKNIEIKIIADAVEKYGNARSAAMHLKIHPSTICRKLNRKADASLIASLQHVAEMQSETRPIESC